MNNISSLENDNRPKESISGAESINIRNIIERINNKVYEILSPDMKLVNQIVSNFVQKARQGKDIKGQTNPRVVRSYIHAMFPELKKSSEFQKLTNTEKHFVLEEIDGYIRPKSLKK